MTDRVLLLTFVLSIPAVAAPAADPPEKPSPEENILQKAGVAVDGDGLLAFFRGRTLSDADRKQVAERIRQLGADDFDDRERAMEALKTIGGRAAPLVRAALHDPDAEIARRAARFLKEVEAPAPLPAVAAARLLARRGPADTVPVLLAYLPFAGDEAVEEEVRTALATLTPDGKADPALAAALDDPESERRAAAAYVLARKGDQEQRDAVRKRLEDADARVRWQAAAGLLAAHDRAAVPALVNLLTDGPFDTAWRAEEVLQRLTGDPAPAVALSDAPEARRQCRDAWAAWWKEKGEGVDVAHYAEPAPLLGYTLGVEYNTSRVWECDLDGSIRWEIRDLAGPMDAQVLPNGHVLIAEADANRVTERDLKGVVVWEKKIEGEPNGCRRLPDGNTFVSTCNTTALLHNGNRAMELTPDGSVAYSIELSTGSGGVNAVRKGRDGRVYYIGSYTVTQIDTSGENRSKVVNLPGGKVLYVDVEVMPGHRLLVADSLGGSVLEANPDGAILWQADVRGASSATRLPNGHTLVGTNHKVVELGPNGKPVWEKAAEGYVRRVYRR